MSETSAKTWPGRGDFTLRVHQGTGLLRPWVGTMTCGPAHVEGVWRARSRPRLVTKMAAAAGRLGAAAGEDAMTIRVENR
jgi:hypothetical protein